MIIYSFCNIFTDAQYAKNNNIISIKVIIKTKYMRQALKTIYRFSTQAQTQNKTSNNFTFAKDIPASLPR